MEILMLIVFFGLCGLILAFPFSKVAQKYESDSKFINFKMLLSACFDDLVQASKLVIKEKQKDITSSDEKAAERTLNQLISKNSKASNNIYRGT